MTTEELKLFYRKKPVKSALLSEGFCEKKEGFFKNFTVLDGQFTMTVTVKDDGVDTELTDNASGEAYVLHRVPGACGAFVGMVKQAHTQVLKELSETCFEMDVFQSPVTKQIMTHIRETYGDKLEYLWPRVPENAVWRRKDTGKWYAALLIIPRSKLGLDSDELVEIIDLRILPEEVDGLVDRKRFFPGFHMNKRHWYTVILDGSVPTEELYQYIEKSYQMAK